MHWPAGSGVAILSCSLVAEPRRDTGEFPGRFTHHLCDVSLAELSAAGYSVVLACPDCPLPGTEPCLLVRNC